MCRRCLDFNAKGITITTEWQRFTYTRTFSNASVVGIQARLDGPDGYTPGIIVWWDGLQVEQKTYATPLTSSTRSSTDSLLDLTGTLNIDTSNVSFNSNGEITYDGTDDRLTVTNIPHVWNSSLTLEAVVSWNDDSRSIIFGNYNVGANDVNFEKLGGRALRFYWNRGERDVTTSNNVVTTTGDYHHVVFVRDVILNQFRFYVDGILVSTSSNTGSNIASTGSTFRVGSDTRTGTTVHNGSIPILKLYDRVLTEREVQLSYSKYKTRFQL